MALELEINNDNQFRVKVQTFFTDWLPNTSANKQIILIVLRYLRDENSTTECNTGRENSALYYPKSGDHDQIKSIFLKASALINKRNKESF